MEYLQVLNDLASVIKKALKNEWISASLFKIGPFTRNVSKLYINGWPCIVNAEDKEYLLLSMKRLNELASVIREALENEGILAS